MRFALPNTVYCAEIWGNAHTTFIEPLRVIQKSCIRVICKKPPVTHCAPLAKDLGVVLLDDLYYLSVIVFMHKIYFNSLVLTNVYVKLSSVHVESTRGSVLNFYLIHCQPLFVKTVCHMLVLLSGML
jgi:hypothetical protein